MQPTFKKDILTASPLDLPGDAGVTPQRRANSWRTGPRQWGVPSRNRSQRQKPDLSPLRKCNFFCHSKSWFRWFCLCQMHHRLFYLFFLGSWTLRAFLLAHARPCCALVSSHDREFKAVQEMWRLCKVSNVLTCNWTLLPHPTKPPNPTFCGTVKDPSP